MTDLSEDAETDVLHHSAPILLSPRAFKRGGRMTMANSMRAARIDGEEK